ncbi:ABC transporter substrate-binding protein [Sinorhizobium mexicanum]|uniref:Carbohydrate ABC transporter substrate-binding protein n=1 Tax=Sinorhizobium mexicanum TaxID=375549 RepID=A0A859QJ41_9HYPH|nr:ABC transporter substrate-binding protein [Sinorhizobium mexicanum]MBP1884151.1 multiple sugar transport system substrate-binding protein [Sinorhizobium mexicanum]QLL64864.1 carbohydrate ABC transporter substrate-binding protein [Sinorhizobium mexicanum]
MATIKALTWDHPRGYNALAAASKRDEVIAAGLDIQWEKQPLEGFESHPIADLCARYDLVVIDHPHVGEAVAGDCLRSLESVFGEDTVRQLGADSIGPSLSSYRYAGKHWALPLDAATQVMALRADHIEGGAPKTWDAVLDVSKRTGKVALSLAGPHAALSFLSIAAAHGEPPAEADPDMLVSNEIGRAVYDLMSELASHSPRSVRDKNPISILGHMAHEADVILCPLVYGYVNYAAPTEGHVVTFADAPRRTPGGRPGSTLGGTGIGISKRCDPGPELKAHLLWLMSHDAQIGFIPGHDGQPSRREAWHDAGVNARWGNFYKNTAETLEAAYVRPRHHGYIAFQGKASALLRDAFEARAEASGVLARLQELYQAHRRAGEER